MPSSKNCMLSLLLLTLVACSQAPNDYDPNVSSGPNPDRKETPGSAAIAGKVRSIPEKGSAADPIGNVASSPSETPPDSTSTQWSTTPLIEVPGLDEPLVRTKPTTYAEDVAINEAVDAFADQGPVEGDLYLAPLEQFAAEYPDSGWTAAVLTDLGLAYYRLGYFSKSLSALERAWTSGKDATELKAKALMDRAVGELAKMHARIGHADELETLFDEMGERSVIGSATELITGAREGLWQMRNDPGNAFLCGPKALASVMRTLNAAPKSFETLEKARSGKRGFTLSQVCDLASEVGLSYRVIRRLPGQKIPVPSVVHWKVDHYAAIIGQENGNYRVVDPIFGQDLLVSRDAIDQEGSGHFLVPLGATEDSGWREVTRAEAHGVHGKGYTENSELGATSADDKRAGGGCASGIGMCVPDVHLMPVSLNLRDTPIGYQPPKGPPMFIEITYNQREAGQPAIPTQLHVGAKWTINMFSYIEDVPATPGIGVTQALRGGGFRAHSGYNAGAFAPDKMTGTVLTRTPATGTATSYTATAPDGSRLIYAYSSTVQNGVRRMFLSEIYDSLNNRSTLTYGPTSLTVTDAAARLATTLYAESTLCPRQITRIRDPFGREAALSYNGSCQLSSIRDVIGITSSFQYAPNGLVRSLTTPYGTTTFESSTDEFNLDGTVMWNNRWLTITDPLGLTERFEAMHGAPGIGDYDAIPNEFCGGSGWFRSRNTFHWDKHVYPLYGTGASKDYTKAKLWHWLHTSPNSKITSPIVSSIKNPLESRICFRYPNQLSDTAEGSIDRPTIVGRLMDDGSTQRYDATYSPTGLKTTATDPMGRKQRFTYQGSNLITVDQMTSGAAGGQETYSQILRHAYTAGRSLPDSSIGPSGRSLFFAYNSASQMTRFEDRLDFRGNGADLVYNYDGIGRLGTVLNRNNVALLTFTYPQSCSSANCYLPSRITDSEGRSQTFTRDNLDRVTAIAYPVGIETFTYTNLDLTSRTDRLGRVTSYSYDANRRLKSVTKPGNRTVRFEYWGNDSLHTLTDENNNVTTWNIDIQGRPTTKTYADGRTTTYVYETRTSRLKSETDALNQTKTYTYNNDNTLAAVRYTGEVNSTPDVTFAYDRYFPRRTSMNDSTGTTFFQYWPLGDSGALKLREETKGTESVSFGYDHAERPNLISVAGYEERWTYDSLDRPEQHSSTLADFGYSFLGQTSMPVQRLVPYPVNQTTSWAYDTITNDRRLLRVSNSLGALYETGYRPSGALVDDPYQVASIAHSGTMTPAASSSSTWDAGRRLTGLSGYGYEHDAAGNLTRFTVVGRGDRSRSSWFNNLNQPSASTYGEITFDAVGNQTFDGTSLRYKWDAENRLIEVANFNSVVLVRYAYDGLGRRAQRQVAGQNWGSFRWCGSKLCSYKDPQGNITRYYEEGQHTPANSGGFGHRLIFTRDHLGNVREAYNRLDGTRSSFDYTAYGQLTNSSVPAGAPLPDIRFGGMYYDSATGLYLSNTRAYDPKMGRWLSRDPSGELAIPGNYSDFGLPSSMYERGISSRIGASAASFATTSANVDRTLSNEMYGGTQVNLYAYVDGDPINKIDPSGQFGLFGCAVGGLFGAAAAWGAVDGKDDADAYGGKPCSFEDDFSDGELGALAGGLVAGCLAGGLPGVGTTIAASMGFGGVVTGAAASYGSGYAGGVLTGFMD